MAQLTVRGFDAELELRLREEAESAGCSLNKAALRLMRRGAGLEQTPAADRTIGTSLDHVFGCWTDDEAEQFDRAVDVFSDVDPELWK